MATRVNDYTSTIVCAYIVYLLLCLQDPAKYYGKPSGDTIDILNIAVNAEQAKNVFFANFKKRIQNCSWFDGKYDTPTQNSISFDKSIRVFSGHSEREAFEGLNLFVAVLDEISAFALESPSGEQGKSADGVYKMYRASVDSRFADYGKVIMLSFPRFCVTPDTPVLTSNLDWKSAGSLELGEELIAFNEQTKDNKWMGGVVTNNTRSMQPCYKVKTSMGEVVVAQGHRWLAYHQSKNKKNNLNKKSWCSVEDLKVGMVLPFFSKPWAFEDSYDSGYVSGQFDGEGSLSVGSTSHCGLTYTQDDSDGTLDLVERLLTDRGFSVARYSGKKSIRKSGSIGRLEILGGRVEVMKFLGTFAPKRLIQKSRAVWEDVAWRGGRMKRAVVESIEPVGFREVVVLNTSSKTYIANGFYMHNCDDYIQQRYDASVAEKEVVERQRMLKLDPDLPDGFEGNEVVVKWEEDHIIRYTYPRLYALRRPTWEVNPIVDINSPAMVRAASEDMSDFLGRFACMPNNNSKDGFFKNKERIDDTFITMNPVDEDGIFKDSFQPKQDTDYFVHVDLAQKHDYCAVAMAHVEKWINVSIGSDYTELHPLVVVDVVRWWTPTKEKSVDFADVRDFIIALRRKGFKLKLTTFDRWNSHDTMNILEESGIKTETLSVANKHYDDLLSVMYDKRLIGPKVDILIEELKQLKLIKGKVDHPAKSTKDLSDATCGAVFNAVSHTKKPVNAVVEVYTAKDMIKRNQEDLIAQAENKAGPIRPPRSTPPDELADFMRRMRSL